ncbi:hypothetical protein [Spiroplasma endosymbiont of Amphimallon solstitiale]|uniref:hypothetical protein n=1 Tax=Spiroplasma endosymbiont of Amphimallon solstitiale TaxID=3066288 RepID=UPI00313C7208
MNKEKIMKYINEKLKNAEEQYNDEFYQDLKQYIKGEIDFIKILLIRVKEGEFD